MKGRKKFINQQSMTKIMKTRIFNLIIIDESGSMQSIKKEAVDSVNETIRTILQPKESTRNRSTM